MQRKSFLEELSWRNMIHDKTPGVEDYLNQGMAIGYIGFDPTAPSLGLGNYVQISLLSLFQQSGNKPIVVMGGATGRIGDPSGKDKERDLKTLDELEYNIQKQIDQFSNFLNFHEGPNAALMVNNYDIYKNMNALDFLRDVGKSMTVNYMLSKESVKKRLETGISFTEFSYQLVQGYDFYSLCKDYSCKLQMGGSDQWGNIISGIDYIGKKLPNEKAYAITTPLLTKADGKKFGKTEEGNIWLDPNLTSPYQFYQFWLNSDDADLAKLFRYFSFKPKEEILVLEESFSSDPRNCKQELAAEMTQRIHSKSAYESVMKVSELLFNKDCTRDFLQGLSETEFLTVGKEIPGFEVAKDQIRNKVGILNLLSEICPIFKSKTEARNALQNNAISINKTKVSDLQYEVGIDDLMQSQFIMIENGKKNKYLITAK
ncbi:MAG: tyrosine--tRNA ligase [Saprospiraceae bacterium]|nr:tyrosine--tRNA ligase [Saprospiraceae bacterium]